MWNLLLKPLLFRLDPERAHHLAMSLFALAMRVPGIAPLVRWWGGAGRDRLRTRWLGLELSSPVGLAAGFDKDARWYDDLAALGFGFIEVGTLTAHPQPGNDRPRLFRLVRDRALINRFGFNNRGSAAAAQWLAEHPARTVLGVNIGKSKVTPNEEAADDYLQSLDRLWPHAAYMVVNVSSPNTKDLRRLQEKDALAALLTALVRRNRDRAAAESRSPVPLLVKVAPDLDDTQRREIVELALAVGLDGIVATNTTIARDGLATPADAVTSIGAGGLSGAPLTQRSRAFVAALYRESGGRLPIVGVGGISTGEEAWGMLRAGASVVQVYTGFVYGGPGMVRSINRYLSRRLAAEGLTLAQLVGSGAAVPMSSAVDGRG